MANYRVKQDFRGRLILQIEETRNHCENLGGTGYYDEYQSKIWRNASVTDIQGGIVIENKP